MTTAWMWIRVEDHLPTLRRDEYDNLISDRVLAVDASGNVDVLRYLLEDDATYWLDNRCEPHDQPVTHWMPLPLRPEK